MNNPLPPDPYKALGVDATADAAAIKTAYRKLVLKCHPDKFPDPTLKAQKQEEFQRVQQAWEILGNDEKRKDYDLEVKAKKLKDELYSKRAPPSSTTGGSRYVNVNVRTAEPPAGWSASSKHTASKPNSHKMYSGLFSQSWENEIPSRSKYYNEEGRTARRAASYEKPRRDDSRERRRRAEDDRERERRREQDEEDEMKRERRKAKERDLRDRELKEREREREKAAARKARDREEREMREARLRDREERDARFKAEAKAERKRERERAERETKRKQEVEEKARAKAKPYVEHSGFSDDDEDNRKSPSKKAPKKHADSPTREKPPSKQRDRTGSREEVPTEDNALGKLQSAMAYAAHYVQETKNKANKTSPKLGPDMPSYSAAYPDPNEKFASPAAKRRGSGDVKHAKGEPVVVDAPGPSSKEPAQQAPPRLQKSYTMPSGYMPQAPPAAPPQPPRGHLNRTYTMQPDHFDMGRASGEKHRPSRRRASFDEGNDYFDDRHAHQPRVRKYSISRENKGVTPRTFESSKYNPYGPPTAGASFSKVKTAPTYGPEHVSTSKRYQSDEVLTSDYGQPSYTEYHPTQAAY